MGSIYVAEQLRPGPSDPEPSEDITLRWASLEEALGLIDDGTIFDSISQVAIPRYALERDRGG
jgi:hypothetical protein